MSQLSHPPPPPPPPIPSTPPSRGRLLALKCYTKAKKSLSLKGLKGKAKGKDNNTKPTPQKGPGDETETDSDQSSVSASSSSCSVGGEGWMEGYEYESMGSPTDQSTNEYEPVDFNHSTISSSKPITITTPNHCTTWAEDDEEDDDSSKWTLSAPSSHEEQSHPHQTQLDHNNWNDEDDDVGPLPIVPSFPSSSCSSSSSDDSFASCASNPDALASLQSPPGGVSPSSKRVTMCSPKTFIWGRPLQPHQSYQDLDLDDKEDTQEDATEKDVEMSKDDDAVVGLPPHWEERPETGPGEEHHYQNIQPPHHHHHPVHHTVVNVPPRVLEVVRERRRRSSVEDETHGRSSRISRLLQQELKVVDQPSILRVRRWMGGKRTPVAEPLLLEQEDIHDPTSSPLNQDPTSSKKQGGSEFEELRRLVKSGGDFCKDLSTVLRERSELESSYAKGLSKLSAKLLKASKEAKGSVAHAWQAVAVQIDTQAELHRQWSSALEEELAKPLRTSTETQHKIRKSVETLVDKTTRNLADWRLAEAKSKRHCFSSSKEFEKLQDHPTVGSGIPTNNNRLNAEGRPRSRLLSVPPSDKDPIKLESKRRKAEENVRRADVDYYTFCIRSERARLEWEGAIRNGSSCLRTLEEEKLSLLKEMATKYLHHLSDFGPRWIRSVESLQAPINESSVSSDLAAISDIRRHVGAEQLLPDFYAEDNSNLMNRVRRREALDKCLYLINQDLEREKKGAIGVESLAKAVAEGPQPADNSHHDLTDKLYYLRSMLLYLEASRAKVDNAMADVEGRPRGNYPISQYMRHQRDKQGLPQTILKVPSWARDDCLSVSSSTTTTPPIESTSRIIPPSSWCDRGKADGTSAHLEEGLLGEDDELASDRERSRDEETVRVMVNTILPPPPHPSAPSSTLFGVEGGGGPSIGRCRAIYDYDANLFDELSIRVGEEINIHDKQVDGWWLGELGGVVGIFPATYVQEI